MLSGFRNEAVCAGSKEYVHGSEVNDRKRDHMIEVSLVV